ncbi:MAG TPA: tetratricopeptide repeat protein, partial [Steroidobacteraceae bacterium]|nr:tetratricopeptide repeat protein [Steroidobacteraceae bacterium]
PDTDPAALADARQKLANIEVLQGHTDRAKLLISQAETFWNHHPPQRYAEERLEGMAIKARVQRSAGDLEAAIATETGAIAQRIALSGRVHRETAVLYNTHGITLTAANRLDDALGAYRETIDIYKQLGLEGELDAQIILGNMGILEYRTGHLREAEGLLRNAYERERALAGDSAAVAAAMGVYAETLTLTDRSMQALPISREAVDIATRYAGASSPVALQNMLFLSDAQYAAADAKAARATLVAYRDAALAQYGPKHLCTLRAQMALANLAYRQGDAAGGRARLVATIALLRGLGARADAILAQALQYLGEIDLSAGKPADAAEALHESISILSRFAASGWIIAVARERLGEALSAAGQLGAVEALRQAVKALSAELGDEHTETVRAKSALRALDKATPAP